MQIIQECLDIGMVWTFQLEEFLAQICLHIGTLFSVFGDDGLPALTNGLLHMDTHEC